MRTRPFRKSMRSSTFNAGNAAIWFGISGRAKRVGQRPCCIRWEPWPFSIWNVRGWGCTSGNAKPLVRRCSINRVCRLMRQRGLHARPKRRFQPRTTPSRHDEPIAPNRLARLPGPPARPNQVWAADLSLPADPSGRRVLPGRRTGSVLPTRGGRELRRLAGRALSPRRLPTRRSHGSAVRNCTTPTAGPVRLGRVSAPLGPPPDPAPHGRTACPYDHAVTESFFATLKTEGFGERVLKNRAEARAASV
jgi:putative transposase